ncbi:MAG: hypothetical protein WD066_05935 [Planctomycetaceae bacterium]
MSCVLRHVVVFGCLAGFAFAQPPDEIDFAKARQLRQKMLAGETLTDEERAYLERAIQTRGRGARGARGAGAPAVHGASTGWKPLSDMTADDRYKGEDGGLYGGGRNEPPAEHLEAALRLAKEIRPRDSEGDPAADGRIAMISIGMSNTTQEFSQFVRLANESGKKSPRVVLVDGAQGGMEAQSWAEAGAARGGRRVDPWEVLDQRLRQAGVSPRQVQVAWIKQARRNPASLGEYPKHADELNGHMRVILRKLVEKFPNLRIAYLSSRIYAGHATGGLNPEPYAYESAFAVRKLILEQVKGNPDLNFGSLKAEVKSPLLLWGPYLWADGEKGRGTDDLVWRRDDLAGDGTHPSPSGRRKVAERLLRFLETDPTAKTWFRE